MRRYPVLLLHECVRAARMARMDHLNKLQFLVRVADHRSFSAAALEAHVRQSTVSWAIASLEQEWGVALFLRSTRHVSLTQAGIMAYERAVAILHAADGLDSEMSGDDADKAGLLRVNSSAAFAQYVLTPLARKFTAVHPRVALEFVSSDTMVDLVAATVDIAFVAGPVKDFLLVHQKGRPLQTDPDCFAGITASAKAAARGRDAQRHSMHRHQCRARCKPLDAP